MAEKTHPDAMLSLPDGQSIRLPVIEGAAHEKAIDISSLRKETGYITLDYGYGNTGACQSEITYVDGEQGILRYRGYAIEDLANNASFTEVAYLLIYGNLPTSSELERFDARIVEHELIHEYMKLFFSGFPKDAHPMAVLTSATAALHTYYQDWDDPRETARRELNIIRLLAKLPTLIAFSYKSLIGRPVIYPDNSLSYSANFLRMMFATPAAEYIVDEEVAAVFDKLLIVHADHEQNCSTSAVRMVGSGLANLHLTVAAGMSALSGALHGGANERVIRMLQDIADDGGNLQKYVDMAKDKDSGFRLYGFGHRVYKNYDPRSLIIKDACHRVLEKLPIDSPLFELALKLEEIALKDEYFVERKLYPNVDFYSGLIYSALGIPVPFFTPMFALGRLPGWIAQWYEMINSDVLKISRPRQIYTGPDGRKYVPIEKR